MSLGVVGIVLGMYAVTYPSRAVALLRPSWIRPSPTAQRILRLLAPAVLVALAANAALRPTTSDAKALQIGATVAGTVACAVLVARGRRLLTGLLAAMAIVAVTRGIVAV